MVRSTAVAVEALLVTMAGLDSQSASVGITMTATVAAAGVSGGS